MKVTFIKFCSLLLIALTLFTGILPSLDNNGNGIQPPFSTLNDFEDPEHEDD